MFNSSAVGFQNGLDMLLQQQQNAFFQQQAYGLANQLGNYHPPQSNSDDHLLVLLTEV
jgi:hypothetical protein